ncbi:hypothetical protein RSK20926_02424 [Roseobacter sp. SK209-2-6]|nr:hypothetical protein RSK20926_02424 [Roseobacter sp. SK209-2-6]
MFLATAAPLVAAPTDFGPEVSVVRSDAITLKPNQARHFAGFLKQQSYFGAFYVNDTVDFSFHVKGFSDLNLARQAALKGCQVVSKGQGTCRAYGEMLPRGMAPDTREASGLGSGARATFLGAYQKKQRAEGYGAYAISPAYQAGMSFGWADEAEARATAISYCEAEVAQALTGLNIEGRAWAKSKGLTRCKVVDVTTPAE